MISSSEYLHHLSVKFLLVGHFLSLPYQKANAAALPFKVWAVVPLP
jgi:hypothetical protein